jgi:hypothetical protein
MHLKKNGRSAGNRAYPQKGDDGQWAPILVLAKWQHQSSK